MPARKVRELLDGHKIKYVRIIHSPVFTAQEVAEASFIPKKEFAKTVMIKVYGKMAMVVLAADSKVNFNLLEKALGTSDISIAEEADFTNMFPECEIGAMPPFGNLYDMAVYVDEHLAENKEIAFTAGTHAEAVKLAYKDFKNLVNPKPVQIAR